jgi:hypothetical protein
MKVAAFTPEDFMAPQSYASLVRQPHSRDVVCIDWRTHNVTRFDYPVSLVVEQICDAPGRYTFDEVITIAEEKTLERLNHSVIFDELISSDLFTAASASFLWPNISLTLRYGFSNVQYRMKLSLFGLKAFLETIDRGPSLEHHERRIGAKMPFGLSNHLAAARLACAVPWVSLDPLVSSASLAWILREVGYHAKVITGHLSGRHDSYYWVEVDGIILDVADSELDLEPFSSTNCLHRNMKGNQI